MINWSSNTLLPQWPPANTWESPYPHNPEVTGIITATDIQINMPTAVITAISFNT